MATAKFAMRRYRVDPSKMFAQQLALATQEFMASEGLPPTLAHVSLCHKTVPERIGPIRIERAWGLYPHEIDLAVEPEEKVA